MFLAFIFALALVSCSSFEFENPNDPRNNKDAVLSSSSELSSGSASGESSSSFNEPSVPGEESSSSSDESSGGELSSSSSVEWSNSLTATYNSTADITLSWDAVSGAAGYIIYRNESADGTYTRYDNVSGTTYTDTNLVAGTTYYYKVAAHDNKTEIITPLSDYVFVTTIYGGSYGSVADTYGRTYKTVEIGTQTWMAENLNYYVDGSVCYDEYTSNCEKYGRLYDWVTAMNLDASCNSSTCSSQVDSKHQGICPEDWHIPSDAEWDQLYSYVGGSSTAGKYLKATSGWNNNGNGFDTYGFAALSGGLSYEGTLSEVENSGNWWSASELNDTDAYRLYMNHNSEYAYQTSGNKKNYLLSVRCVKDY